MLALVLVSALIFTYNPRTVRATGTIYIRTDGSIDPATAPISNSNNTRYTFTADLYDSIVVERGNIIIDGADFTLQGSGSGNGFALSGINNVTIRNTNIKGFYYGIYVNSTSTDNISENRITAKDGVGIFLENSMSCNISGNNIANSSIGVSLYGSSDNVLFRNSITYNSHGFYLYSVSNCVASGNNLMSNKDTGIWLSGSSNVISENSITNNAQGIYLYHGSDNSISKNHIVENSVGMYLYISSSHRIFHNDFLNNTRHVSTYSSTNVWDDGYPSGGNYWSDYTGVDSNHDGIGDTPYFISPNNIDNYPLVFPYIGHNIAVVGVEVTRTVIALTAIEKILVEVINNGSYPQTFSLTICANTTEIQTLPVSLIPRSTATFAFFWDTSHSSYGHYVVTAYVWPVLDEFSESDNQYILPEKVTVTVRGDVNGDGTVNLLDLVSIGNHLLHVNGDGHMPYSSDWHRCLNTDINNDGTHNILDFIICSSQLNQHWP